MKCHCKLDQSLKVLPASVVGGDFPPNVFESLVGLKETSGVKERDAKSPVLHALENYKASRWRDA